MVTLSGCVSNDSNPLDTTAQVNVSWKAPAIPVFDSNLMLAEHKAFVKKFPVRTDNLDGHRAARDFLAKELADAGLEVWRQKFHNQIDQENICGIQVGQGNSREWVIVGAHYDTTTTNTDVRSRTVNNTTGGRVSGIPRLLPTDQTSEGAYDDGSGTRLVVDLAKKFARQPTYFSVVYCLFDGEERGLHGSQAFKRALDEENFPYPVDRQRAMLDLDMFGLNWPIRAPIGMDHNNYHLVAEVEKVRTRLGIPEEMIKYGADDVEVGPVRRQLGTSDYGWWMKTDTAVAFFISDFTNPAPPIPGGQPETPLPPAVPATVPSLYSPVGAYPFWHVVDTYETMEAMAGGPEMLRAGFQTALDLSAGVLHAMTSRPDVTFGRSA